MKNFKFIIFFYLLTCYILFFIGVFSLFRENKNILYYKKKYKFLLDEEIYNLIGRLFQKM